MKSQDQQRVGEYHKELTQLKDELIQQQETHMQSSSTITKSEIASIQATIAALQSKIEQNNTPAKVEVARDNIAVKHSKELVKTKVTANQMLVAGSAGLVIVALGANAFFSKNKQTSFETTESSSLLLLTTTKQKRLRDSDNIASIDMKH